MALTYIIFGKIIKNAVPYKWIANIGSIEFN